MTKDSWQHLEAHVPSEDLLKMRLAEEESLDPEREREIEFKQPEKVTKGKPVTLTWKIKTALSDYTTQISFYHKKKIKCRVNTAELPGSEGSSTFEDKVVFKCIGMYACIIWMYYKDLADGKPTGILTEVIKNNE